MDAFSYLVEKHPFDVLMEARWHNPRLARLTDAEYVGYLTAEGFCLNRKCTETGLHCHLKARVFAVELKRLLT